MRPVIVAGVLAVIGCSSGITPKVRTDTSVDRLQQVQGSAKGTLAPLARHAVWAGERLKVAGIRDGLPVMERVGPWRIELHPDPKENVVELKGFLFAKNSVVTLDLDRDVLVIDGEEFPGRKITGKSPMFEMAPFQGLKFEREGGKVFGAASIFFLEDGRVAMDFDKVVVAGNRAREYGALSPAKQ